jgi:DNA-binding NarL/FixJ family response regulator
LKTMENILTNSEGSRTARSLVAIIGRPGLQNKLFANILQRHLGVHCMVMPYDGVIRTQGWKDAVALLDVDGTTEDVLDARLHLLSEDTGWRTIAIFNVGDETQCETLLRWPKVKGIFARDTSEENLVKGVRAVCRGEYWLSRKMLADFLDMTRVRYRPFGSERTPLTPKELETLGLMTEGASNGHIALALNVSPHTVKTHIYNLFKKIKVRNRVQAVSWALKNGNQTVR